MSEPPAALVSGASSGIGLAIATVLAEEGHRVTLTARRADKLDAACRELRARGHEVQAVASRIGAGPEVEATVVQAHEQRYGRLDVLVNNVGVATSAPIAEMPEHKIDLQLAVNVRSVIAFYRAGLPLLRAAAGEHGTALVVNTASASARSPRPSLSVYAATKAAVIGFTDAMNVEIGGEGIKSCALCPGYVATSMTEHIDEVPAAEMIEPGDVGEMVRALLRLSAACVVPRIDFERPGGKTW